VLTNIPGVSTEFSQPIQMRFNELMTGVRSDVAVKIFGEDIDLLSSLAEQALSLMQNVSGVEDARAESVTGLPQITVKYNKDKLALYGLNVGELNQAVRTGFAGEIAGMVYEGEKRYDLVVRLAQDERQDLDDLQNLFISLPPGSQIPLKQVADVSYEYGPIQINREEGKRRVVIGFNVRNRDVKSIVNEIQGKLEKDLKLPAGYYLTYGGQFENLTQANQRLMVAVPVALGLIFSLLFFTFGSIRQSLLIFTAIPLSAIGGVFALWLRGMPFSISAGVGFIALFGVSVLNGIVLIGFFNQLKAEGMDDVLERIREGARVRLRPVVMTAAVASLGFLPMAISTGAGAEVQKPLATVVIGGLISATLLTLIVLPVLYHVLEEKWGKNGGKVVVSVLLLLFLPLSNWLKAQNAPIQTLDEALELAYQNNPQIQAGAYLMQSQETLRGAAGLLPKTNVQATLGQFNTYRLDQNYTLTQGLPNPTLIKARRELALQNALSAQASLGISRQELTYQIRQSWHEMRYLLALKKVLAQEDSLLGVFVRGAALKYKTGESTLLEKTSAETRQQQVQQSIKHCELLLANEKLHLQQLSQSQGREVQPAEDDFSTQIFALSLDTTWWQNNAHLKLAEQKIGQSLAEQKVLEAEALPDFSVGYFVQSLGGPQQRDGQEVNYNGLPRFQGLQAGISLPIFGGKAYRAREAAAGLQVLAQQKSRDQTRSQLQLQLRTYAAEYQFWQNNIAYYRNTALPNARLIANNASKGYSSGEIGYVEYLQALQINLDLQKAYLEALRQAQMALLTIQFLTNQ
jgi:heavy metal efflux system protein